MVCLFDDEEEVEISYNDTEPVSNDEMNLEEWNKEFTTQLHTFMQFWMTQNSRSKI